MPLDTHAGFAVIAAERRAFADQLDALTEEQWATPSLCTNWTVRDVVAHTMIGPTTSLPGFVVAMAKARFDFNVANDALARKRAERPTSELVALLRDKAEHRFTPPGFDWHAPLTDLLLHRLDCFVPLGIEPATSSGTATAWAEALGFIVSPKARKAFGSLGMPDRTYVATDLEWTTGSGPRVEGPASALAMALTRRPARLDELSGPGKDALAAFATG